MRKSIFLLLGISFITGDIIGQDIKYDVASIPDSLKKDVAVVKRYHNTIFTVNDIDRASLKVHTVYTILNKNGERALRFTEYVDKFSDLSDAEIRVYDANGKQTDRYKKKDFYSRAINEGLVGDDKVYYYGVTPASYPVTVEFIYEKKEKATLFYPPFKIIIPNESVEFTSFTAKVPAKFDLRYKEKNIKCKPVITEEDGLKVYTWTVKSLKPIEYEEGSVSYHSRYPKVILAPNKFKMDNFEGDMTTWQNFGMWETNLQRGLDVLPEERKAFFRELVKNTSSEREKARLVYNYLQKNFRYVSIQLGIGGFRPFPADFTDKKKYGDCKALSYYMYSVLNMLGVKSYTALINAEYNQEPVDPAFPCNQFNHMILCIPQAKDSIWLECTSNTAEFGVLGTFTENRNALLITETGGVLVPTPKSKSKDNQFYSMSIATINEDGSGACTTRIKAGGDYKEETRQLLEAKKDDQKLHLVHGWGYKQPDEFAVTKQSDSEGEIDVTLGYEKIPEFSTGSKMFLKPQLYTSLLDYKLPKADNRKLDYYFEKPFEDSDTTVYILPPGYTVDALPQEKNFSCDYGQFTSKYWFDEKEKAVKSATTVVLKHHIIPAAKYAQVKTFFDAVYKEASQRIVIKKI